MTEPNYSMAHTAMSRRKRIARSASGAGAAALTMLLFVMLTSRVNRAQDSKKLGLTPIDFRQTQGEADAKSTGCASCHGMTEAATMHPTGTIRIGCADCHGGDPGVMKPGGAESGTKAYDDAKRMAHPKPSIPRLWKESGSANPVRSYTDWLQESKEYIRFVNPGDLRVAEMTCGTAGCHESEVRNVRTGMMTHGAMLWQAALYNYGAIPYKNARFGESYSADGSPQRMKTWPPPSQEDTKFKGVLPQLDPL